jgi:repressor LexA
MRCHPIQEKLLKIVPKINLRKMSLRDIGSLVDETHPQKIKHHLNQLEKKGLVETDKKTGEVKTVNPGLKDKTSGLVMVPVYGDADCGEACVFAEENLSGYIRVSKSLIGRVKNIFAVRAQGPSMNKAKVNGRYNIEEGDYVLIDPDNKNARNGDYVLSVIDECANIKKFFYNKPDGQIVLASESTEKIPSIFIRADDKFMINGLVKNVIKSSRFDEWQEMQNAAGRDALKSLGPISKKESDYYRNLK